MGQRRRQFCYTCASVVCSSLFLPVTSMDVPRPPWCDGGRANARCCQYTVSGHPFGAFGPCQLHFGEHYLTQRETTGEPLYINPATPPAGTAYRVCIQCALFNVTHQAAQQQRHEEGHGAAGATGLTTGGIGVPDPAAEPIPHAVKQRGFGDQIQPAAQPPAANSSLHRSHRRHASSISGANLPVLDAVTGAPSPPAAPKQQQEVAAAVVLPPIAAGGVAAVEAAPRLPPVTGVWNGIVPAAAEVVLYAILRVHFADSGFTKKVDSSSSSVAFYEHAAPLLSHIAGLDRPDSPYSLTPRQLKHFVEEKNLSQQLHSRKRSNVFANQTGIFARSEPGSHLIRLVAAGMKDTLNIPKDLSDGFLSPVALMAAAADAAAAFDELECVPISERLETIHAGFSLQSRRAAGWDWDARVTPAWRATLMPQTASAPKHLRLNCDAGGHYHNHLSVVVAGDLGFHVLHAGVRVELPPDAPSSARLTTRAAVSDLLLYLQGCRACYGGASAAEMHVYSAQRNSSGYNYYNTESVSVLRFSPAPRAVHYPTGGRIAQPTDDPLEFTYEERHVHFSRGCSGLVSGASSCSRCSSCHTHTPSLRATLRRSNSQHEAAQADAADAAVAAALAAEQHERALKKSETDIMRLRLQSADLSQKLEDSEEKLAAAQAALEASREKMAELPAAESQDLVALLQQQESEPEPESQPSDSDDCDSSYGDSYVCQVCGDPHPEDTMLCCDGCDLGFHTFCLKPALGGVPDGEWLCAGCTKPAAVAPAVTAGRKRAVDPVPAEGKRARAAAAPPAVGAKAVGAAVAGTDEQVVGPAARQPEANRRGRGKRGPSSPDKQPLLQVAVAPVEPTSMSARPVRKRQVSSRLAGCM